MLGVITEVHQGLTPLEFAFTNSDQGRIQLLMTRHEKGSYEGKHIIIGEGVFIDCTFKNCSLEHSGGDTYVQNCRGENCQLVWRDASTAHRRVASGSWPNCPVNRNDARHSDRSGPVRD